MTLTANDTISQMMQTFVLVASTSRSRTASCRSFISSLPVSQWRRTVPLAECAELGQCQEKRTRPTGTEPIQFNLAPIASARFAIR